MSSRTVDQVDEWEPVSVRGGYEGLRTLADREFSGAVVAGPARLFMLNGTVIGIVDGDIEDYEDAEGTAREAPHESLPLLAVMQAQGQESQGQYYTEDTSISDVDATLSDGNFTGYVELSENVLSGDYYVVYHQGRSMSVAWVGTSEQLVTGDEAFQQADDEVGIYEVFPADIEPIEIPGSPTTQGAPGGDTSHGGGDPQPTSDAASEGADDATSGARTDRSAGQGRETRGDPSTTAGAESRDQSRTTVEQSPDEWARSAGERTEAPSDEAGTAASDEPSDAGQRGSRSTGGPPGSKSVGGREPVSNEPEPRQSDAGRGDSPETADEREDTERTPSAEDSSSDLDDTPTARRTSEDTDEDRSTRSDEPQSPTTAESQASDPEPGDSSRQQSTGSAAPEPSQERSEPSATRSESDTAIPDFETRSIPSLDPERSTQLSDSTPDEDGPGAGDEQAETTARSTPHRDADPSDTTGTRGTQRRESTQTPQRHDQESQPRQSESASTRAGGTHGEPSASSTEPTQSTPDASQSGRADERVRELRAELDERTATVDQLETEIADLEAENTDLRGENEDLRAERERLEAQLREANQQVAQLEDRVSSLRNQLPEHVTGTDPSQRLAPEEALDGTNLFVRYNSKSDPTLADARDGSAAPEDVDANLRIQYHTQFEAESVTVDGRPFHEFLTDCLPYRFVSWLVTKLLYEIRDTGHATEMEVLYDALPEIDRVELNGQVSITYVENGDEHREQERYDVVVRDRMGNPLIVANINDRKEPATEEQMSDLLTTTERLGNTSSSLAAAFLVTESFFAPEALETAEEATASGLFSRSKRASFVSLSRSDGYHLCLLEAREGEFNMAVPEL
ncbi:DUF7527 domain-containing protein [Haloarcula halophila]|uniref:DUF7527 domain-containing protein n=1 Tax=Haloarcula TaxID=2237 RepID=UPI0023E3FE66|nr:hypothetical protein [Halomicroarcula sp. DFY41]